MNEANLEIESDRNAWRRLFKVAREERLSAALLSERFGFTQGQIHKRLREEGIEIERAGWDFAGTSEQSRMRRNRKRKAGGAR